MAKPILEHIEKHNHKAYFVGGCVRDLLLDRPIGDIDIATSASPAFIQEIFPKVIPVGIEHGTVIVRHQGESYEVTTFRVDGEYSDRRHPDSVQFIDEIDKDLERRDFTINALAMDLDGNIIDLFGGKQDIANKIIRTVGNGYERFMEDALRIIRALRFSSQLGFVIHPQTLEHMKTVSEQIKSLAIERITNEFTKLFAGNYLQHGIEYFKELEIGKYLPVFSDYPEVINEIPNSMQPLHSFGEVIAMLHILKPEIEVTTWTNQWKCSNRIKQEANQLVEALNYYQTNQIDPWLVYQLNQDYFEGFIRLIQILEQKDVLVEHLLTIKQQLPIHSKSELAINGHDLIEMFPNRKKGPWLKTLIHHMEAEVVFRNVNNTKNELKDWIKWNPPVID